MLNSDNIRYTGFQVNVFVLVTVEASPGMDEDGRHKLGLVSHTKDSIKGTIAAVFGICHG